MRGEMRCYYHFTYAIVSASGLLVLPAGLARATLRSIRRGELEGSSRTPPRDEGEYLRWQARRLRLLWKTVDALGAWMVLSWTTSLIAGIGQGVMLLCRVEVPIVVENVACGCFIYIAFFGPLAAITFYLFVAVTLERDVAIARTPDGSPTRGRAVTVPTMPTTRTAPVAPDPLPRQAARVNRMAERINDVIYMLRIAQTLAQSDPAQRATCMLIEDAVKALLAVRALDVRQFWTGVAERDEEMPAIGRPVATASRVEAVDHPQQPPQPPPPPPPPPQLGSDGPAIETIQLFYIMGQIEALEMCFSLHTVLEDDPLRYELARLKAVMLDRMTAQGMTRYGFVAVLQEIRASTMLLTPSRTPRGERIADLTSSDRGEQMARAPYETVTTL